MNRISRLLTNQGHIVAVEPNHTPLFGDTFRPVCIEDNCRYVGPFVPEVRAHAIAEEHRLKSVGAWKAAK